MNGENSTVEMTSEDQAEVLLRQLMHLKHYETPDPSRMTRNKQNIMREVRKAQSKKRKSLVDLIEINIPWFFAEPKYGIAALFVAVIGLQYAGMTARNSSQNTGIYTTTGNLVALEQSPVTSTNQYSYPDLPRSYQLFTHPESDGTILPAGVEYKTD